MAQDFYRRAQILHEEFQKRELHYLNAEKKWNNMIWKKDLNMPLQEYLQKLDKREMETEETYKSLMKQMEELDKHTELMSLKLERLGILQSNITNMDASNWLHNLTGSNSLSLETANILQKSTNLNFSVQRPFLNSTSTQTENKIYCKKCSSEILIFNQSQYSDERIVPLTAPKFLASVNAPPEETHSSKFLNSITSFNETQNISQFISSSVVSEQPFILPNSNKSVTFGYKSIEQADAELSKQIDSGAITEKHTPVSEQNLLQNSRLLKHDVNSTALTEIQDSVTGNNIMPNTSSTTTSQTVEIVTSVLSKSKEIDNGELKSIANDKTETPDIVDNDASVSKSDKGSINHEFDFLESDTANVPKDEKSQVALKVAESSKEASPKIDQTDFPVESKSKEQNTIMRSRLNDIVDNSDTSESATGPKTPSIHSADLSLASDSDSIGEKGTPLKASAAYQALLGNTTIFEKKTKQYSDSESEDEIENALSNAVRKNSQILPKPKQGAKSAQPKKDEKHDVPQVESKPSNKPPKPSSANKPQSKLSKSTRKVLGLETSSGSEVEIAAKPPGKKIEEDSDEFDFFD